MIKTLIRIITIAGMILIYAMLNAWLGVHIHMVNTMIITITLLVIVFQVWDCRPTLRAKRSNNKKE